MCDINNNKNRKCGGSKGAPVEIRPGWLKCPPNMVERSYPVPDGVDITPISEGGRNGPSKKKQFKCGQCGVDSNSKPKQEVKPNVPADCPMVKARCPGLGSMEKNEGKGGSIIDRIKNFLGIGKDLRLVEACKHLKVQDEQIRHHRDVFNTKLICRKDGYFAPLFTKVDCRGQQDGDCSNGTGQVEEEYDDEYFDERWEDEFDDEFDDYETYDDENTVENMICMCTCNTEQQAQSGESSVIAEGDFGEEEECVEDAEGECIIEESAECMDPACKFFFEDQKDVKKPKEKFSEVGLTPEIKKQQECIAMNNFLIRVQAPLSEKSTNETCEQIIARLTNKQPQYPEPPPRPEKSNPEKVGPESENENIQLVVKQISVEKPTCECPPKPVKCKNKQTPKMEKAKDTQTGDVVDECNEAPKSASLNTSGDLAPSSAVADDASPPLGELPSEVQAEETFELPPVQNDCETLSEEELLRKPLKDIKCGCPKQLPPTESGTCYNINASVWIPPPPPPCPRCGVPERGGTEDCYLCHLTRRMRSGCPEIIEKPPSLLQEILKDNDPDSCSPEYLEDGSLKYKGGMCMSLANSFLWHIAKRTPPGGFFDRYTGECGEDVRLQALTGTTSYTEAYKACYNRNSQGIEYCGGLTLENCNRFLWGQKYIKEEENAKTERKCKQTPKRESSAPPPQCPAPPK